MALRSNPTTLSKLDNKMRRPKITARIFKVWDAMDPENGVIYSTDFMLIDEEGTAIEGTIDVDHAKEIRAQMTEGMIFEFTNFQVFPVRTSYRTVNHDCLLKFSQATIMNLKHEIPAVPTYYFNFESLENIGTSLTNTKAIVDVIGKITAFKSMQTIQKPNRTIHLREIEITNERGKSVPISIWGNHNKQFDQHNIIEKSKLQPIIVAFSSLQLKMFRGCYVLTTYSAARIFFDENISQIAELKQKFDASALVIPPTKEQTGQSLNLQELPTVTTKELLEKFASDSMVKEVNCVAIIGDIDEAYGWYYNACPTHLTRLKFTGNEYKCDACKTKIESPQPCYRFCAVVIDETEEAADFVFLGRQGEQIMGCTALALQVEHDTRKRYFPNRIKDLIGHEFNGRPKFNVINASPLTPVPTALEPLPSSSPLTPVPKTLEAPLSSSPKTPAKSTEISKRADSSTCRGKEIVEDETTSTKEEFKINTNKKRLRDEN